LKNKANSRRKRRSMKDATAPSKEKAQRSAAPIATTAAEAIARIDLNDAQLRAWAYVDRSAARAGGRSGPLSGMPFGVKDLFDVAGMPTRYGLNWGIDSAPIDAWCVAALRAAGAVPIGKTHTTALAHRDPAPTRNPHQPEHTPGGSSAGSAAAVAAGHVPFALGTQTSGSGLRPASFCGVVGYKPTYGIIPVHGMAPYAPSLDTVAIISANAEITARVMSVFAPDFDFEPAGAPRVGYAPETFASRFEPQTLAALQRAADAIARAGAHVERIELPSIVAEASAPTGLQRTIVSFEANAVLRPLRVHGFPPLFEAFMAAASEVSYEAYRAALAQRTRTRPQIAALLARYDVLLLGCANPAPRLDSTGDATPLLPWSLWGMPSLALPVARSGEGLPIGVQLVAAPGCDDKLLRTARWIEGKGLTEL
jgi:Asp-tRNA(Asn)/Glu-tRNA(Gln) amidotransferase A subunit family amidase